MTDHVTLARRIADDVLFPAALDVDRTGTVPDSHFRLLADEGFYGLAAPVELGGSDLALPDFLAVLEILTGGCLATAFTWVQHHGALRGIAGTANDGVRTRYLPGLVRGDLRAGVAFAGAIPQPPRLLAKPVDGGYLLSGEAPFVSGWHTIDVLLVSARLSAASSVASLASAADADADARADVIVSGVIEPGAPDGPVVTPIRLVAAQGSDTVRLTFADHFLPATAVTGQVTRGDFLGGAVFGARVNGAIPLGVAGRCVRLLADAGQHDLADTLTAQIDAARDRLDAALADPPAMPAARAVAGELAHRIGGATVAAIGSAAITVSHHAQRLAREAMVTLVTASRPDIRTELIALFERR